MSQTPPTIAPLSPHWAFVMQLQEGTALTAEGLHGRVEHVVSGPAAVLTALEALRAFMAQVLTGSGQAPGRSPSAEERG